MNYVLDNFLFMINSIFQKERENHNSHKENIESKSNEILPVVCREDIDLRELNCIIDNEASADKIGIELFPNDVSVLFQITFSEKPKVDAYYLEIKDSCNQSIYKTISNNDQTNEKISLISDPEQNIYDLTLILPIGSEINMKQNNSYKLTMEFQRTENIKMGSVFVRSSDNRLTTPNTIVMDNTRLLATVADESGEITQTIH